jgi:hypothetical protein
VHLIGRIPEGFPTASLNRPHGEDEKLPRILPVGALYISDEDGSTRKVLLQILQCQFDWIGSTAGNSRSFLATDGTAQGIGEYVKFRECEVVFFELRGNLLVAVPDYCAPLGVSFHPQMKFKPKGGKPKALPRVDDNR